MRLAIIGRLPLMLVMLALRGTSISTTATRTTTISPIVIMFVVLGQESEKVRCVFTHLVDKS